MAVHVHVSKSSATETNKVVVHHMPCLIKRNGPANVSSYFEPNIDVGEYGILYASFRGYPLLGKEVDVQKGYTGFILRESQEKLSEECARNVNVIGSFDKFTYWNHDRSPTPNDQIMSAMDWIDISAALHSSIEP